MARRHGDFAIVGAVAGVTLDGDVVTFEWTQAGDPYIVKLFNGIFGKAVQVSG